MKKKFLAVLIGSMLTLSFMGCTSIGKTNDKGNQTQAEHTDNEALKLPSGVKPMMSEKQKNEQLEALISKFYEIPKEDMENTKYFYNYADLDMDGKDEIFAVVVGSYTSGSGGDSAIIVKDNDGTLEIAQNFTLINEPVIISDNVTNGQKDIVIGIENSYYALTFEDGKYLDVNSAKELENSDSLKGTAIIADDMSVENSGLKLGE